MSIATVATSDAGAKNSRVTSIASAPLVSSPITAAGAALAAPQRAADAGLTTTLHIRR